MFDKLKNKIEAELLKFSDEIKKGYCLQEISPLLFQCVKEFILRKGKRVRPVLFSAGYLGFAAKPAAGLYKSALSMELLHDFMLIHDDIIDKSPLRRGKPSMHSMLDAHLKKYKNVKFSGQDLAIVTADVIYAIAVKAFLSIKERADRKEKALKNFVEAAMYTGSGEFIELMSGVKSIKRISKKDIYKIYDYKTSRYTFSTPLTAGATLGAAPQKEVDKLFKFGIYLGRAFQIKDDILGMFGDEAKIGKSTLCDLQEAKKTLLIYQAYKNSQDKDKLAIRKLFTKKTITQQDLLKARKIIENSGALDYAKKEISRLKKTAKSLMKNSKIKKEYKNLLMQYSDSILNF